MIFSNEFNYVLNKTTLKIEDYLTLAVVVIKFAKIKGDMVVFENISRKKNKKYFEEMERILNEYKR